MCYRKKTYTQNSGLPGIVSTFRSQKENEERSKGTKFKRVLLKFGPFCLVAVDNHVVFSALGHSLSLINLFRFLATMNTIYIHHVRHSEGYLSWSLLFGSFLTLVYSDTYAKAGV